MDKEASSFWKEEQGDLIGALQDNLRDFGDYENGLIMLVADHLKCS